MCHTVPEYSIPLGFGQLARCPWPSPRLSLESPRWYEAEAGSAQIDWIDPSWLRPAPVEAAVQPLIRGRWNPSSLAGRPVEPEKRKPLGEVVFTLPDP